MRPLSRIMSTVNFFLFMLLCLPTAIGQEAQKKEIGIGDFTPEKAIELLLAEPLDEAVTYTEDENGPVCEYRNKTIRFQVRFCDNPKKGRVAGRIIHTATRQAIAYLIQLRYEGDFDYSEKKTFIFEDFTLRRFQFYFPYIEFKSGENPNQAICEAGYYYPPPRENSGPPIRSNFSRCDQQAAGTYQAKWRASGEKLREDLKNQLLIDLTNLHITKYSTPPPKK